MIKERKGLGIEQSEEEGLWLKVKKLKKQEERKGEQLRYGELKGDDEDRKREKRWYGFIRDEQVDVADFWEA